MTDPSPVPSDRFTRIHQLGLVVLLLAATFAVAQARAKRVVPEMPATVSIPSVAPLGEARVEVAFVLDTTGSMSGLIEGAKQKIWSIANQMASNEQGAGVRIALIGYRDRGDDYVTKRFDLTTDIDSIYGQLRAFQAAGGGDGPESVNQALHEAIHELSWSDRDDVYRVVFLVGDAPPHMDYPQDVAYGATAKLAKQKGIVLNTVQCGSNPGTTPVWREIAGLGAGQYAAIAQDGGMVAMAAPMDDELAELNRSLASTVIEFGEVEEQNEIKAKVNNSVTAPASVAASRLSYMSKAGGRVISGMSDLVDAVKDGLDVGSYEARKLPEPMRAMKPAERKAYVEQKRDERERLQAQIDDLSADRDVWVKKETKRRRDEGEADGFDAKVFGTIQAQAAEKGIVYAE